MCLYTFRGEYGSVSPFLKILGLPTNKSLSNGRQARMNVVSRKFASKWSRQKGDFHMSYSRICKKCACLIVLLLLEGNIALLTFPFFILMLISFLWHREDLLPNNRRGI